MQEKKINEFILKISSAGVNLPVPLEQDNQYRLATDIQITEIIDKSNQDGTINQIFKGKQTGDLEILGEGKNIIKAKGKKKVSQSIHSSMWYYWSEQGLIEDFDNFYERNGKKISAYMPDILEFLKKAK